MNESALNLEMEKNQGAQIFIHSFYRKRRTGFFFYSLLSLLFNCLNPSDKFEINDN